MNLATLLSVLAAIVGVLSFTGAVVNGKKKDNLNQILVETNNALRDSQKDKDIEIAGLTAKLKLANDAAEAADKIRQQAIDIAQSRPQFDTLGSQMIKQHKELLSAITKSSAQNDRNLTKLTVELGNIAKAMAKGGISG